MLQSLPEIPLHLRWLHASNCKRLRSLPEIPLFLEELDTSILEKLSKYPHEVRPRIRERMSMKFTNCLKLNEEANKKILADLLQRIQHMAVVSLRPFHEEVPNSPSLSILSLSLCVCSHRYI